MELTDDFREVIEDEDDSVLIHCLECLYEELDLRYSEHQDTDVRQSIMEIDHAAGVIGDAIL